MHGLQDQNNGGNSGGSRNCLGPSNQESNTNSPNQQKSVSLNNSGTHLAPASQTDDPDDDSRSPSRPRTPSVVNVQDPSGKTTAIYRDNNLASDKANARRKGFYDYPENSGSENSFASIKTITDLGFERQAQAKPAADRSSELLRLRNVRSESNASSLHANDDIKVINAQKQVATRLRAAYCKSTASDKDADFIPISEIESILTQETVEAILRQELPGLESAESKLELDKLAQDICRSRRRLFALLLLNFSAKCIKCFVQCGVTDMDFPFAQSPNSSESAKVHPRGDVEYEKPIDCFSEWKPSEVEWFLRWQHVVASPFFDLEPGRLYLYPLPKDSVLPFIESERAGEGGYAHVWKVMIHPAHHSFPPQPGIDKQYFAVKTLYTQQREEYEREVETLQRFSGRNEGHPHLIRLLLTYQHNDSYHMIFPWANGNLRNFWERVKSPQRSQDMARWMLAQFFGIAEGLQKIHGDRDGAGLSPNDKNTGRHGDLKPENILWFERHNDSNNHLLICDFGLSRFHSYQSQSVDSLPGCSPSYRPPECDLHQPGISVKYDIWTLGCLLLDFLTWYPRGWEAVDTLFIEARLRDEGWIPFNQGSTSNGRWFYEDKFYKFYKRSDDGRNASAQLKPSVIKWMEELHRLDYCPEFAHDLLKIIHKGLLHPDKRQRWNCGKIVTELGRIREKCGSSPVYYIAPSNWDGEALEIFTVSRYMIIVQRTTPEDWWPALCSSDTHLDVFYGSDGDGLTNQIRLSSERVQ
ncbi:kinase-like domain-containing protein [Corynascus novoguineensis]|uniref:Kinase-like domain-containing protein n=1 Tax=Corynascus novoguineensis TaxID=1126955 RepID=A0AAN7CJG6_9PEZI|nr:kinase-like domain-containing protein [Corynascus novoguineensis]